MIIMLAISIPLAYYMVFRAGKWELFLLLSLVLADELAPVVKIYAWQVILGRNGIINWLIPGPPVVAAVQPVRRDRDARGHVHHVHDDPDLCRDEGDRRRRCSSPPIDLGAGWWVQARRILIPLAAPGIFIAMILVYIPMLTDFVTADIVGGTGQLHDGPACAGPDPRLGRLGCGLRAELRPARRCPSSSRCSPTGWPD